MDRKFLPPGTPIARRFWRGDQEYWISGYEIFDPKARHSIKGGYSEITPRRSPRIDQCLVIGAGQVGRPIIEDLTNIQLARSCPNAHKFEQVYGSSKFQSEKRMDGYSFDDADDLFIGKST